MLTSELQLLLLACEPHGLSKQQIRQDLADPLWVFPAQTRPKARQLHRIFDPYRESAENPNRVKCSASELLGVYQLLRYIIARRVPRIPDLRPQLSSFDAACLVMDTLMRCKQGLVDVRTGAATLQAALTKHLGLHLAAYGDAGVRPKSHWNVDLPI